MREICVVSSGNNTWSALWFEIGDGSKFTWRSGGKKKEKRRPKRFTLEEIGGAGRRLFSLGRQKFDAPMDLRAVGRREKPSDRGLFRSDTATLFDRSPVPSIAQKKKRKIDSARPQTENWNVSNIFDINVLLLRSLNEYFQYFLHDTFPWFSIASGINLKHYHRNEKERKIIENNFLFFPRTGVGVNEFTRDKTSNNQQSMSYQSNQIMLLSVPSLDLPSSFAPRHWSLISWEPIRSQLGAVFCE